MAKRPPQRDARRPLCEELEPRILLSADISPVPLDAPLLNPEGPREPAAQVELLEAATAAAESVSATSREIAFVDTGVEGWEQLVAGLRSASAEGRSLEVVLLDAERDGVTQIGETLAGYAHLDAVHVLSHGSDAGVRLGNTWLSADNLDAYRDLVAGWGDALSSGADLLFYGCELGASAAGQAFVGSLAGLTGADVAASVDLTGSVQLGGDWDLEYATGRIETGAAFGAQVGPEWIGVLATNTAPVNSVPGDQSIDVGATLVFSAANGNPISISDADAVGADVEATLSVSNGTLTLAQTTGLAFSTGDGAADATMTFSGAVTEINSALDELSYTFNVGFNGTDTLALTTRDLGNTGTTPLDQDANIQVKYPFEAAGADAIGSNDATLVNGASVVVDAERGNVLSVDGVDDYASVPAGVTSALSQFSFSFWAKTTESGTHANYARRPTLMGIETPGFGTEDFDITTNDGFIGFWTGLSGVDSFNYLSTTTRINDDAWHQITVANDGVNADLYVDGVFEASLPSGNGLDVLSMYVGAQNSGGNDRHHHQGQFDDVRIFDRALTSQEVEELYSGLSDTDTVTIQHLPTAADGTVTTLEDTPHTFVATEFNFSDVDSNSLAKVRIASLEGVGALQLGGVDVVLNQEISIADLDAGNLKFTPTPDASGTGYDSFQFEVHDGTAYSSSAYTMTVDVTAVNDAPTATGESYTTAEDTPLTIAAPGVLTNDGDVDGDALSAALVSGPTDGTLVLNGDGSFTYTPDADFNGSDSFTYEAQDPSLAGSGAVTVTIDVTPANDPPTAVGESYTTAEDTPLVIAAPGVLTNDGDVDGDVLSAALVSGPTDGTLVLNAAGSFAYTPDADFAGTDSFSYEAQDPSLAGSGAVTVTIDVTPVNDAPVLMSNSLNIGQGETVVLTALDLSATDIDSNPAALLFTVSNVQGGQFELASSLGSPVTNFSQAEVAGGQVQFVHDGSSQAPSYDVVVGDGSLSDSGAAAVFFTPGATPSNPTADESGSGGPVPAEPPDLPYADIVQALDEPEAPRLPPELADDPLPEDAPAIGSEPVEPEPAREAEPRVEDSGATFTREARLRRFAAEGEEALPAADLSMMDLEERRDSYAQTESFASARTSGSPLFWQALDQMRREMTEEGRRETEQEQLLVAAAEGLALITSSGLLAALLRSESLLALALSYLPIWRRVDPMAILILSPEERKKREQEIRDARKTEDVSHQGLGEILDEPEKEPEPPEPKVVRIGKAKL